MPNITTNHAITYTNTTFAATIQFNTNQSYVSTARDILFTKVTTNLPKSRNGRTLPLAITDKCVP